jgi:hypothetical protein
MNPYNAVPSQLKNLPNWVCWKSDKIPYIAANGWKAKADDPSTWTTFKRALDAIDILNGNDYAGIGFELGGTSICGIDFDNAITDKGVIDPYTLAILNLLGSPYTETSPSGRGLHAFVECDVLPEGGRKMSKGHDGIEIYHGREKGRYFTITGSQALGDGVPIIADMTLPYMLITQNKDKKFKLLWLGDTSAFDGDDSSADFALMKRLAVITQSDPVKMEKYFGASALGQRGKWKTREDYRERTIAAAIESVKTPETKTTKAVHLILEAARASAAQFDMDSIVFDPTVKHPEHEHILQGFITVGDSALVIGAKKAEKSLFGLRWAMHMACGKSWCGFTATRPRRISYLDGENDARDVNDRYSSMLEEFSPEEQQLIGQNLVVIWGRSYTDAGGTLDYLNDQWWDSYAKQTQTCEIHFLDCLYLFHDKESYDNNGLREVMDVLRYRINSTGPGRTVVMLHHSRSMSNDDLRSVDKLSLERLGPTNFSETSFGGKVLLKNATLVVCLDKQTKRDEDGEIESQAIFFQFYGRRVPESPLLKFEDSNGKFARRLVRTLSKGARKSIMDLRLARGDNGSWVSKNEATKDLKCVRSNAYRHLDEMTAKEYLLLTDGRYHLHLTADLIVEISRVEEHSITHDAAVTWLRQYVTSPMKAENVIEVGDEAGHTREALIEARPNAGLVEEPLTDASMVSILMWRPKKKRGGFTKGSAVAKEAAEKRWVRAEDQAKLAEESSDFEPKASSNVVAE